MKYVILGGLALKPTLPPSTKIRTLRVVLTWKYFQVKLESIRPIRNRFVPHSPNMDKMTTFKMQYKQYHPYTLFWRHICCYCLSNSVDTLAIQRDAEARRSRRRLIVLCRRSGKLHQKWHIAKRHHNTLNKLRRILPDAMRPCLNLQKNGPPEQLRANLLDRCGSRRVLGGKGREDGR